jgi:enamine deaminase RidA (YjgF/YER057c/UK114 family)
VSGRAISVADFPTPDASTMPIRHLTQPDGLPPASGYSHAVIGEGTIVAISGQLPLDASGRLVGPAEPFTQAQQVFTNLRDALHAAGATPADVIRLGFFVIDLDDLAAIRRARDAFLGPGPPPASSLVQVAGLVVPGARVEIDALAVIA